MKPNEGPMNSQFVSALSIDWSGQVARIRTSLYSQDDCDTLIAIVQRLKPTLPGPLPLLRPDGQADAPEELSPKPQEPATDQVVTTLEEITPPERDAEPPAEPEAPVEPALEPETPDEPAASPEPLSLPEGGPLRRTPKAIVAELYPDRSISTTEIGRRAGIPQSQVSKIAQELGLEMRGRPGARLAETTPPELEAPVEEAEPDETDVVVDADGQRLALHGVTIDMTYDREAIVFGGKRMDLTTSQAAALGILLRAAPNPVGHDFIADRLYRGTSKDVVEMRLATMAKDLAKGLPDIGLELYDGKGVGMALRGCA